MRYTTIGSDSAAALEVSVLSLGTMWFGTRTDEARSFAILDRYVAAGGNFIDTSNSYLYFVNGTQGGESEALLGRWRASRGIGAEIVMATKVGARPSAPTTDLDAPREGLSRAAIREASARSRERLGVERIDLYYAHVPDQTGVPLDEQVAAFGELAADGTVGLLGLSNHWAWQGGWRTGAACELRGGGGSHQRSFGIKGCVTGGTPGRSLLVPRLGRRRLRGPRFCAGRGCGRGSPPGAG
jgi:aryl-alcohol dehydrogenase-like predicted oxidoreductase